MLEIICVPAIVSLVFSCIEGLKAFLNKTVADKTKIEKVLHFLPLISGGLGAVFGVVCFFALPQITVGADWLTATLAGAASGLSATGCNQVFKQLKKLGVEVKEDKDGGNGEGKSE
jgi:hypothetical protein